MESNKPLRTHPKMTKVLLGQIDSLDKAGHSVEDIAATLNTTPEAVQRGIDKLIDRRHSEIRATPGGAFTVAAQKKTVRAVPLLSLVSLICTIKRRTGPITS